MPSAIVGISGISWLVLLYTCGHFKGSLPIEGDDWQVGVIVGRSGSGKTSIAKQLFPEAYIRGFEYSHKCVLDDFPEEL